MTATQLTPRRAATGRALPPDLAARLRAVEDPVEQLGLVFEHHRARVEAIVRARVGDHAAAEDAALTLAERLLRRHLRREVADYREPAEYRALVGAMMIGARNLARDVRRDGWREVPAEHDEAAEPLGVAASPADSPEEAALDGAELGPLFDALRRLPAHEAQVLRMVEVDELTVRAAGERLGISKSAVFRIYQRARGRLDAELARSREGAWCAELAPHLAALEAEIVAVRDGLPQRPLAARVGAERAGEIRAHVWGDPANELDPGCLACRGVRRRERAALRLVVPPQVLLPLAVGLLGWLKGGVAGVWRLLHGLLGGKTAAVVAAGTLTVATGVPVATVVVERHGRHAAPPRHAVAARPRASAPVRTAPARRTVPKHAAVKPKLATAKPKPVTRKPTVVAPRTAVGRPAPVRRAAPAARHPAAPRPRDSYDPGLNVAP
ncbi:MAG TPA: sigma-70 family RNA polymerase sigma factor [Miltoncostaeaceae bacterium]|nr:sigma-70 family RNA polymerase sigma factor [Miltoncostaeaceae bacterium]